MSVLVQMRSTTGRGNDKAEGHPETDGTQTEGIIYADGTSQRMLANHVCMYK